MQLHLSLFLFQSLIRLLSIYQLGFNSHLESTYNLFKLLAEFISYSCRTEGLASCWLSAGGHPQLLELQRLPEIPRGCPRSLAKWLFQHGHACFKPAGRISRDSLQIRVRSSLTIMQHHQVTYDCLCWLEESHRFHPYSTEGDTRACTPGDRSWGQLRVWPPQVLQMAPCVPAQTWSKGIRHASCPNVFAWKHFWLETLSFQKNIMKC